MKTGNLEKKINALEKDLLDLQISWRNGTHQNYKRVMDANWVGVTIPDWRVAKNVGAKKDGYYGWILWSSSTNDNGTAYYDEVRLLMEKHDLHLYLSISERQL